MVMRITAPFRALRAIARPLYSRDHPLHRRLELEGGAQDQIYRGRRLQAFPWTKCCRCSSTQVGHESLLVRNDISQVLAEYQ